MWIIWTRYPCLGPQQFTGKLSRRREGKRRCKLIVTSWCCCFCLKRSPIILRERWVMGNHRWFFWAQQMNPQSDIYLCSPWHVTSPAGPRRWSRRPSWTTTSWRTWSCLRSMRWWTACTLWIMGRMPASSRRGPLALWSMWWKVSRVSWFWGFSWVDLLKLFFWVCFIFVVFKVQLGFFFCFLLNFRHFEKIALAVEGQLLLSSGGGCDAEVLEKPLEILLRLSSFWHFQQQHTLPEAHFDLWQLLPSVVQRVRRPWACWMLTSSVLRRASVSFFQGKMGCNNKIAKKPQCSPTAEKYWAAQVDPSVKFSLWCTEVKTLHYKTLQNITTGLLPVSDISFVTFQTRRIEVN